MHGFSAIKMTALGRPQFLVGTKIGIKMSMHNVILTDSSWWRGVVDWYIVYYFQATVLRGPGEMATIFHIPCITAGKRWHGDLRAEAGAETTAGAV